MKRTLCFENAELVPGFPIRLEQTGVDRFTVIYGKQVEKGLNYSRAAHELGACIMHACALAGVLDNREEGER